jgi:hypothetical protein
MASAVPRQLTVGEICRRLGEPFHRVRYVIQSRGIVPESRAGVAGVFTVTMRREPCGPRCTPLLATGGWGCWGPPRRVRRPR